MHASAAADAVARWFVAPSAASVVAVAVAAAAIAA